MGARTVSSDDEEEEFEEREDVQDNEAAVDNEDDDEEEDEDEEGQDEYEKDDFIVDDVEEEEEEAKASSDEEARAKKKKRKKRDAEENYELDEDDYELLQEANVTGFHRPKSGSKTKFKRLKKAGRFTSENGRGAQMGFSDDEDMEEGNRHGRTAEEELKRTLFGDDEGAPPEDIGDEEPVEEEEDIGEEDEMADFIVDEEEVDENGQPVRRRKDRKRGPRQASGISSMALQEAQEIFGDVAELLDRRKHGLNADRVDDEEGMDEDKEGYPIGRLSKKKIEEEFEPSVLEEKYMTAKDNQIREIDMAERLQLLEEVTGVIPVKEPKLREAEWIYDRAFGHLAVPMRKELRYLARMDKSDIVKQIGFVLTHLHDHKLEIPFIGMYRKEGCLALLEDPNSPKEEGKPKLKDYKALWQVFFWDRKWWLLQRRKDVLKGTYQKRASIEAEKDSTKADVLEKLLDDLQEAESEVAVDDVDAKFVIEFPPDDMEVEQGQFKRPKRRSLYSMCRKSGLKAVAEHFGLTPEQFGENLQAMYKRHEVEDSSSTPEDIAMEHSSSENPDPQSVLRGARHMAAVEISTEPAVREYVRNMFSEKAVVTTKPTKEGNTVIDPFHQYAMVNWLLNKPVNAFNDGQWLLIQKAEEEKLLEVTVGLPKEVVSDGLMQEFETLYLSDGVSRTAQLWNEQRKLILKDAVSTMLLPLLEKETRMLLVTRAKQWVAWECGAQLWKKVSVAPHTCPKSDADERTEEDQTPRVMACCLGAFKPPTTFVMLDSAGEVVNTLYTPHLNYRGNSHDQVQRKQNDLHRLFKFLMEYQPHVVVLGAANMQCKKLKDAIYEAIFKIVEHHPRELADGLDMINVNYADEVLPRIYEASSVSMEQLPGQPDIVRRAVGLGRYLQNPLAMVASLCGPNREILSLKLHQMQGFLTDDERYDALEQVMITITNQVGVDLNMAASHEWLFTPLQFVSGLGARKASMMQRAIQGVGRLSTRKEMLTSLRLMKRNVFVNACGFLRIRGSGQAASGNQIMDPLDDTRIHPESYELAKKMAETVYIEDQQQKNEELDEELLEMALEHVKENPNLIKNLDIEEYAGMVFERDGLSKLETLKDIQMELLHGYRDWRTPYSQPTQDEEFSLLTGEDDETLFEGALLNATVFRIDDKQISCNLECGLRGTIQRDDFSDKHDADPLERVSVGSIITCRVKSVSKKSYYVDLTCKGSDLRGENLKMMHTKHPKDPYHRQDDSHLLDEQEKARKEKEDEKRKSFKPRMIVHPQFQNVSMADAIEALAEKDVGEIIIRPSSKGPTNLSITLKFYDGVYTHIDVLEGGKDSKDFTSFLSLGKTLQIGDDTFEDLDEVIARYVDPLVSNLKEMLRYRKFRRGKKEEIDSLLRQEKAVNPSRIVYAVSVSYEHHGAFMLSYLRSVKVHHEYITLSPKGYKFRKRVFDNIDKLVNYFQRHVNDPVMENPPHRSLAAMVPMKSPAPAAGTGSGGWGGSDRPSAAVSTGWDNDGWNSTKGAGNEINVERAQTPGSRAGGNSWGVQIGSRSGAINDWGTRGHDGYARGDGWGGGRGGLGNRGRDQQGSHLGERWGDGGFAGRGRAGRGDGTERFQGGRFGVGGRLGMSDGLPGRWGHGDGGRGDGGRGWVQAQNDVGSSVGWGNKGWGEGTSDTNPDDGWDMPNEGPTDSGWGAGIEPVGLVAAKNAGHLLWGA